MSSMEPSDKRAHILVVDDAAVARIELVRILENENFFVSQAENGSLALDILKKNSEIKFIFSDYNMPSMNGLQFIAAARDLADYKNIKSAVITTEVSVEIKAKARELGVVVWILKPFKPASIVALLEKVFPTTK